MYVFFDNSLKIIEVRKPFCIAVIGELNYLSFQANHLLTT